MTDQKSPLEGKLLPPKATKVAAGKISGTDALSAFNQVVEVLRDAIQIHETESTKREKLKTYRETEVLRIQAAKEALRDYFDRTYEERRETNKRLFDSLDLALAAGDVPAMQAVLGGIVEVARTSPLANAGDLGELQRAMADPNTTFEF